MIQEDGHLAGIALKPNIFPVQPAIDAAVTGLDVTTCPSGFAASLEASRFAESRVVIAVE